MSPGTPDVNASELGVDALVADILTSGSEKSYHEGISGLLGLPLGAKAKRKTVQRKESADGLLRCVDVLLDPSTTTPRVMHLVLRSDWKDIAKGEGKTLYLRLNGHGVLEKAFESPGKIDTQGRDIRGSGVGKTIDLDIRAPQTKLLLQRELDFWLKGIGRKPKLPAAESPVSGRPSVSSETLTNPAKSDKSRL